MSIELRGAIARAGTQVLAGPADAVLRPARVASVVGPNGAGKSTLLRLIAGQRAPDEGQVLLDGEPVHARDAGTLALRRALMPQEGAVAFDFSAREICELGRYPHRRRPSRDEDRIVDQALAAASAAHLAQRSYATLSGGEKARVQLARALAQVWEPQPHARWLLLDEPTAALDLAHQHEVMRLVNRLAREEGLGIVVVLHDLNLAARYADDVLLLQAGERAVFGPRHEVLEPERIARTWSVPCRLLPDGDGPGQFVFA